MPQLLKSMFRNAGIPTNDAFEGRDRWEGTRGPRMTFIDDGNSGSGAGGGGDGQGGSGNATGDGQGNNAEPKTGKSGGGSGMSDTEAKLLQEVMEKKNKLKEVQDQLSQVNAKLKDFEGLDAAEIKKLLKEKADREAQELEAKGQWEALKKQMSDQHAAEIEALNKQLKEEKEARTATEQRVAELAVSTAFGNSKFIAEKMSLPVGKTRVLFGAHFETVDGVVVGFDKPAGAKGRVPLVDASGNPVSFDVALEKLVMADPDKDNLLKSTMKTGAGSGSERNAAPPKNESNLRGQSKIKAALDARKK